MGSEEDINWKELAANAWVADSRRRGFLVLSEMYTQSSEEFAEWLRELPEEDYFEMILGLLTAAEFLVEASSRQLKTTAEYLLACLVDLSENA